MKTGFAPTQKFKFYFPDRDTLVRVESSECAVIIRASRDTFSEQRKSSFIRELAAEGFIPDDYRWSLPARPESDPGVRWVVDIAGRELPEIVLARARCFTMSLLIGVALIWLAVLAPLFLR